MARVLNLMVLSGMIAATLSAQSVIPAKSGLISYIEGNVYVNDRAVEVPGAHLASLQENAVVRTERGRAEVLIGPCTALQIGDDSSFRLASN